MSDIQERITTLSQRLIQTRKELTVLMAASGPQSTSRSDSTINVNKISSLRTQETALRDQIDKLARLLPSTQSFQNSPALEKSSPPEPKPVHSPNSAIQILSKRKLMDLVAMLDPQQRMDSDVQDALLELADTFIESVTTFSCMLAKHRQSNSLDVQDLKLHVESQYNIRVPGFFASANVDPLILGSAKRKAVPSNIHAARVAAVKKAIYEDSVNKRSGN